MILVRDVATLKRGERVYVHDGDMHIPGVFLELVDGDVRVDVTVDIVRIPLASNDPFVTDVDGEVIAEPEPVLETIPPDLE